jgi:hypothetical protein
MLFLNHGIEYEPANLNPEFNEPANLNPEFENNVVPE